MTSEMKIWLFDQQSLKLIKVLDESIESFLTEKEQSATHKVVVEDIERRAKVEKELLQEW